MFRPKTLNRVVKSLMLIMLKKHFIEGTKNLVLYVFWKQLDGSQNSVLFNFKLNPLVKLKQQGHSNHEEYGTPN